MEPILTKTWPGLANRQDLVRAARTMAEALARKMGRRVYRGVHLEAVADEKAVAISRSFPAPQGPERLPGHATALAARLTVSAPVTSLTIRLEGLSLAVPKQLNFFEADQARRQEEIRRFLEEADREGMALIRPAADADRRERMLSFYDPFRRKD